MPLLGQASGGWTESSSALRILYVGVRNSVGILTDDAFTQTNPPIVTAANTVSASSGMDTAVLGVLGGSVAFVRSDVGANYIGGPTRTAPALPAALAQVVPVGVFINNAVGRPYENTPGPASGKGPYVSGLGTFGNSLYETEVLVATAAGTAVGTDLTYVTGMRLVASRNGYLMPSVVYAGGALDPMDSGATATSNSLEASNVAAASATLIGVLKMPADSVQPELVYDQRI